MANKKNKLIHAHSSIANKNPKPEDLEYGEIAVNYNGAGEFIAIKSTSTDKSIARISADRVIMNWVDKKQVFPISGSVITTEETGPELEIELNQVVSNLSPKSGEVMKGGNENPGKFRINLSGLTSGLTTAEQSHVTVSIPEKPKFDKPTLPLGDAVYYVLTQKDGIEPTSGQAIYVPISYRGLENFKKENDFFGTFDFMDNVNVGENLTVVNNATISGTLYTNTTAQISDINLKDNIKGIDNESVEKVKGVVLKTFNYKSDASKRKMYGAIAQDVENAGLSELVYTDDNGVKSLDYTGLLLLKIAELENRIKELEKK